MPDRLTTHGPNAVISDQGMMYWRTPDGRIFAANMDERDYARKVRRGYQPLDQYGFYSASAYYMDHPHEPLFQAGGAHELRVEDVIALGYAQRRPLVPTCGQHVGVGKDHLSHSLACWSGAQPVVFPQLDGVEVPQFCVCEYCDRDDLATEQALQQHTEVMHTERRQQEGLSAAIIEGLSRGGALGGNAEAIAAAVTATLQAMGVTPAQAARQQRASAFPDDEDLEEASPTHAAAGFASFVPSPERLRRQRPPKNLEE